MVEPAQAEPIIAAVLECVDPGELAWAVALGRINALDQASCMADAWDGLLTRDLMAASMAHGRGLDDVPTDVVAEMASKAADCEPNHQWWVDEIIIREEFPQQLTSEQIECAAARYVDVLGIDEVIRRRILGVHLLVLRVDDENALDLGAQCGITELGLLQVPTLQPGVCLTTSAEDGRVAATGCDQPHDAEIYSVYDVDQTDWPGHDAIRAETDRRCRADAEAIETSAEEYGLDSISPDRASWERGRGTIACIVVRADREPWTGPSGLVPADRRTDDGPSTVPPTTPPAAPSLFTEALPPIPGYESVPWTEAENGAFLAGPYGPPDSQFVEEFAGGDVEADGQPIARIELHLLWPQYRKIADGVVLDAVSGNTYSPGPQTTEQATISGEQVLIRRTPTLTAWSWFEDGILFNVVANEVDPLSAGNFVAALTGSQQTN